MTAENVSVEFRKSPEARYAREYASIRTEVETEIASSHLIERLRVIKDGLNCPSVLIKNHKDAFSLSPSLSLSILSPESIVSEGHLLSSMEERKRACIGFLLNYSANTHVYSHSSYERIEGINALYHVFIDRLYKSGSEDSPLRRPNNTACVLRTISKGETVSTISELLGKEKNPEESEFDEITKFTGAVAHSSGAPQELFTLANVFVGLEKGQECVMNSEYAKLSREKNARQAEIMSSINEEDPGFNKFATARSQADTLIVQLNTGTEIPNINKNSENIAEGLKSGVRSTYGVSSASEAVSTIKKIHYGILETGKLSDQAVSESLWKYLDTIGQWTLGVDNYEILKEELKLKSDIPNGRTKQRRRIFRS